MVGKASAARDAECEARYLETIVEPIRVCAAYRPKMGRGVKAGLTLRDFQRVCRSDPFYSWFGLDNALMYAAHRAAGGMTSIYRQIGIGSERLVRAIFQDQLGLSEEDTKWSYSITTPDSKVRTLSLDARISLSAVRDPARRRKVRTWIRKVAKDLDVDAGVAHSIRGVVFEVRQGYKSKDSKRQNADIANAATAYTQAYLPCVLVMSAQIDTDILVRYRSAKWAILTGRVGKGSPLISTYAFMGDIIGFDLAGFFDRHAERLRTEVASVLEALLAKE